VRCAELPLTCPSLFLTTFDHLSYDAATIHLAHTHYPCPSLGSLGAGYIGEFEIVDDHRGGKIVIQLNGRLNKTGVISPRFNVTVDAIENWVNLLLPARSFGKIILTTSAGIMDHEEARRKHVSGGLGRILRLVTLSACVVRPHADSPQTGGKILAYVY
jgi:ribosomal protein S8